MFCKFVSSTRSFADFLRNRSSPKRSSASRSPRQTLVSLAQLCHGNGYCPCQYHRQMLMLDYLLLYPTVHISLHAGELAPASSSNGLRFHSPARSGTPSASNMVSTCLRNEPQSIKGWRPSHHGRDQSPSNDVILGITLLGIPPAYRAAGVPSLSPRVMRVYHASTCSRTPRCPRFNLVSRSQNSARTSIERLPPGASLWQRPDASTDYRLVRARR